MAECICSSCKNLKGIVDDNGEVNNYECQYGYPSESCGDCDTAECDITCENYISDEQEDTAAVIRCEGCGRELTQVCGDNGEGSVYCMDCYLKNL